MSRGRTTRLALLLAVLATIPAAWSRAAGAHEVPPSAANAWAAGGRDPFATDSEVGVSARAPASLAGGSPFDGSAAGVHDSSGRGSPRGASAARPQDSSSADSTLDSRTRAVASGLRCPVCQGLSIQDSPTELAREMRAVVRDQLAAGRTAEQVHAYFVSKYGEWILLEPEPRGLNLAVYLLPVFALLGGAGLIAVVVRRWTRHGAAVEEPRNDATEADPAIDAGV